ncbi:TonB-dependent receptor [Dysgonomonas sp. 216]|uniref:TonB-dependent receptor n=1 Tax=Dysgonomonas sp. 216 TaxID=2302934 RepID=UPI0013D6BA00|nr:TonB-dependent receptor [Dysgonomonas sp. 216]NDW19208.1 TonB-dependent receptor [Dysgonomonas sp. 216]
MKQKMFFKSGTYRFRRFVKTAYAAFNSMHKVVSIGVVTGGMLVFANAGEVKAQATTSVEGEQLYTMEKELEEVMVTAAKVEVPLNQTAKQVTVISKEQVAQAPVQSIQDLLVYVAGIDVIQRGAHGVQADISIRGGSSDQNAILLNGVNITNAHTGHYNLDIPISLSDIERIEIIHGPSALIYGSSAFSGGINIITKKKADSKLYAKVEGGMHNLKGIEVRGAVDSDATSNSLSVTHNSSDGYTDNSDYNIFNALWQSRFSLENGSKIDLQLGYNDKKYGANTFYSPKYPNQYERTSTYLGSLKGEFGSVLKFIPIIYWNRHHDQFDLIKDTPVGRNFHRNDTYGANLIFLYRSKFGSTSLGSELRKEDIMSTNLGKEMVEPHRKYTKYDDRTNASISLEHSFTIDKFNMSAGVMMNHNTLEKKKYKFYPAVSATYRATNNVSLSSSWSKSTRIPTFVDLYYSTETHTANEGLKPERSESFDLGVKYHNTFMSAYATGFFMWGRNIIDWVKENPNDTWASWNHTKLNTKGVEAGVKFRLGKFLPVLGEASLLSVEYTRLNGDSDTKGLISKYSMSYLRDKLTTQFHHRIYGDFSASWFFRFQKRMGKYEVYEGTENTGKSAPFKSYSTLDLKLNYTYNSMRFYINVNNLYDTGYFDLTSIPQPGFWLMGGVSYTIH